jgi:hypothetical protein
MKSEVDKKPWYRQGWLWFVLTPLIVVVCVSSVLVTVAFRYSDDVVIDNYYKQGRMINQALEQDRKALEYGLTAQLRFDRTSGEVIARTPAHAAVPEKLLLLLDHPFEANLDQQVILHAIAPGQYRGDLDADLQHNWYLIILPQLDKARRKEAEWILSGEINFSQGDQAELKPRVNNPSLTTE